MQNLSSDGNGPEPEAPLGKETTRDRVPNMQTTNSSLSATQSKEEYYKGFFERWLMQEVARQIALDERINPGVLERMRFEQKYTGVPKLPRICKCMHCLIHGTNEVQVLRDIDNELPHYKGLLVCGSVWACPICATKISEGRKNDLIEACDAWTRMGNGNHSKSHVIFTIPHYSGQSLSYVREKFMDARRKMKAQKPLKRNPGLKVFSQIEEEYGIRGTVTAQEVTYGDNGWHVHSHDLFFFDHEITEEDREKLRIDLSNAWLYALKKVKLDYFCEPENILRTAIKVKQAKSPADYITKFGLQVYEEKKEVLQKWGASEELTKAHIKKGKKGGKTPWDLLREIVRNPDNEELYLENAKLWNEYVTEFKGKRQLFFSKNFRKTLGLGQEKTDQELAEADNKQTELLGILSKIRWKKIIKNKMREKILLMAMDEDWDKLTEFIDKLK